MNSKLISLLTALLVVNSAFCVTTKKVKAEYIYHVPENVSPESAKSIALQRAQAQAIADEFGTVVTQSSSIYIETSQETTNTDFLSIGGSELKGEWIETIGEPIYKYITDGDQIALCVEVSGVIREITGSKVPFELKTLRNGTENINESDNFKNGDDLYMSFQSPAQGYLAIYLIDNAKEAYCLLPYSNQEDGFYLIKSNKRYILFSPDNEQNIDKHAVDEIILETTQPKERNRIVAVFSPNKFYKANDNRTQKDLPRNLSYADFQKWLTELKKKDTELSISEKAITIFNE